MIRVAAYALCLFLTWPMALWAQSVGVRSGEHEDFTRLVFNLPERINVALRYEPGGISLSFDRDGLTFNTETVFERVPATRLTAMTADANTMSLALACKCDIRTFWASDRAFVIDIGNETTVSAALFPAPVQDTPTGSEPDAVMQDKATDPPTGTPIDLAQDTRAHSVGSVAFLIADAQDRLDQLRQEAPEDLTTYATNVRDSQDAIIEQIGRAATQGLLSPRDEYLPQMPAPVPEPLITETTRNSSDPDATNDVADLGQNLTLNAQTSVDQALSNRISLSQENSQSTGCLNPTRIDVAEWAGEGKFVDQIGSLRSAILGEFDQPSDAAILKLVRFYIHFGFGVEARQVANMLPDGQQLAPELNAMIRILDRGHDTRNSIFAGQMDCEPLVAVWSLLSYEKVPGNQPIDPDNIVLGILDLPTHLRAYLGPIVGQKLRMAGYRRAADHVARALVRNVDTTTASAQYLRAKTTESAPEEDLGAVIAENAEPAADALLELIDRKLENGEAISEDLAILAGAYAMENRNEPTGPSLGRAYLLSLTSAGEFSEAFDELDRLTESGPVPTPITLSELMLSLAQDAPNPAFLTQAIGADQAKRFALEDEVGNAVATRLVALGFPEAAERFVAPMASDAAERARKLIRAEIALQTDRPRQAELELIGEDGDDVMQLLARARSNAGEHSSAQKMYAGIDEQDAALRQAWLEGDWQTLVAHSDPAIAAVAERQTAPISESLTDVTQVLARNTEMLEDSQSMRAEIEALLSGITVPAPLGETDQ